MTKSQETHGPEVSRLTWDELEKRAQGTVGLLPTGAMGDPTLATREKGERLAKAMLKDGFELLNSIGKEI